MSGPETPSNPAAGAVSNGLGQIERAVDAYVSPSKTFIDVRRSASWWLPFLLAVLVGYLFTFAVQHEVGFQKLAESTLHNNAQLQQRASSMSPEQLQQTISGIAMSYRVTFYAAPVFVLLVSLIAAGVLMMSFNLGLGAQATFSQYLAVWMYAYLPMLFKSLLACIALFAGLGADQFRIENPVGTNIGFYLGQDAPKWLNTLLSFADIFSLWTVVLLIIGAAIVARVKRGQAAIVVVGWWVLIVLFSTGMAAVRGQ